MACKKQIIAANNGLLVRAPAKINLSLLVAGKRPDGFHELETIMAKVNWYDEILIRHGRKTGIELSCRGQQWAPQGKENLVYMASELLLKNCGSKTNIKLTLTKNIPAGSGLGGASSDAAATLTGLNDFLRLGVERKKLHQLASQLGSDVSFFLNGPLALCTGKGEKIKKIDEKFDFLAVLILSDVNVSTKKVYNNYKDKRGLYEKLHGQINGFLQKNRIDLAVQMCANMLQTSCFKLHDELAETKERIESLGMWPLSLCGSGSGMFFIIENCDVKKACEYQQKLKKNLKCESIIVRNNRW